MKLWDTAKHWGLWIQLELCWPMAWKCKKFCFILYRKTLSGDTLTFRLMLFDTQTNAQGGTLVTEFLEVKSFFFVKKQAPNNNRLLLKTFVDEEKSLRLLIPDNPHKKEDPARHTLQKISQDSMTLKRTIGRPKKVRQTTEDLRFEGLKRSIRQVKISDSKDFHGFCCMWCYEDLRVSEVLLKVMLYEDLGVFQVLLSVKLWRSQDLLWRSQSVGQKLLLNFWSVWAF